MNSQRTVPEHVARELASSGVTHVYGVPGGEGSSELIQALAGSGVEFVLCHTESQAAFAAAAMAEITGSVGVVLTSLGPGAASAVNGAAHALLDRVPLLVITDRFPQERGPASGHQFIDQTALYTPVTKGSYRLHREDPAATVREAVGLATRQPRGPVHIDFPADLADAGAEAGTAGGERQAEQTGATHLGEAGLEAMAATLERAARPVVLCGLGVLAPEARPALAQLLTRLRAPALTTYKAIGAASEAAEWNAGIFTGGAPEGAFLDQADLILTVGFDAVEMIPTSWRWQAPVMRLSEDPTPCPVSRPEKEALGPLPHLLEGLVAALGAGGASAWTEEEVGRLRERNHERVRASWTPGGVNPTLAVEQLIDAFPNATFSVDAGAHMFAATLALGYKNAGRCSISNGLSTMGYALPAAIGAVHAEPGRPAVAITGDGGLSMCLAELETAVRSGGRLVVFLLNDAQLSLIKIKQEAKGHAPRGVGYGHTDWTAIAAAYGARPHRAGTMAQLESMLADVAAEDAGVDFVEVVLEQGGYQSLMETVRGSRPKPAAVT